MNRIVVVLLALGMIVGVVGLSGQAMATGEPHIYDVSFNVVSAGDAYIPVGFNSVRVENPAYRPGSSLVIALGASPYQTGLVNVNIFFLGIFNSHFSASKSPRRIMRSRIKFGYF